MKIYFLICVCFTTMGAVAQTATLYHEGVIVTSKNDTIYCLVPMVSAFGTTVLTKKTQDGPYDSIPVSRIKYLANGTNVYETVNYNTNIGMQQKLMWLQEEGTINLYQEYYFEDADKRTQNGAGGTFTFNGEPVHTCVVRKNGQNYLLSAKQFIAIVKPLVADNPAVAAKVDSKKYTLENIDKMIEEYNGAQ